MGEFGGAQVAGDGLRITKQKSLRGERLSCIRFGHYTLFREKLQLKKTTGGRWGGGLKVGQELLFPYNDTFADGNLLLRRKSRPKTRKSVGKPPALIHMGKRTSRTLSLGHEGTGLCGTVMQGGTLPAIPPFSRGDFRPLKRGSGEGRASRKADGQYHPARGSRVCAISVGGEPKRGRRCPKVSKIEQSRNKKGVDGKTISTP